MSERAFGDRMARNGLRLTGARLAGRRVAFLVGAPVSISWLAVLGGMLTIATPLVYGALGAILGERAGVLNLGIEGTMYAGAFVGFLVADKSGHVWVGLAAAIAAGAAAGAVMALLAVTIGVNQHVAGIGITLALVAACDFTNRVLYSTGSQTAIAEVHPLVRRPRRARAVSAHLRRPAACWRRCCGGCSARPAPA